MEKFKSSFFSCICCCARDEDTPQPTPNIEPKKNSIQYINEGKNSIQLEVAEFKPETPKIHKFPYNCPICFRYFNKIYKTVCCENYICELCTKDLEEKNKNLNSKCLYCNREGLIIKNVQSNEIIKTYTDSPYIEKVIKATKTTSNSRFKNLQPLKITLNDVIESQKEINISKILERTLSSNYHSDGFIQINPKPKILSRNSVMDNSIAINDLCSFRAEIEKLMRKKQNNFQPIKRPDIAKIRPNRLSSLN